MNSVVIALLFLSFIKIETFLLANWISYIVNRVIASVKSIDTISNVDTQDYVNYRCQKKYPSLIFNRKDKNQNFFLIEHSLEKSFTMVYRHTNLCGSRIWKFIVKEVAVLRKGAVLSYYIFTCYMPWNFLTKFGKYCASWLSAYHGLQWEDEQFHAAWRNDWVQWLWSTWKGMTAIRLSYM